jgi:hypothetical protein
MNATKSPKPSPVFITRCEHCGHETHDFAPGSRGNCPRCSSPFRVTRRIVQPHPNTTQRAISEGHSRLAVNGRLERLAAEYDRRGDVVLRDQARRDIDRLPV